MTSLRFRDYPSVQLGTVFVATVVVVMSVMTDLVISRVDPRVRLR